MNSRKCSPVWLLVLAASVVRSAHIGGPQFTIKDCDCERLGEHITTVDCSQRAMSEPPDLLDMQPHITDLDLSLNHLTEFPVFAAELPNLRSLDLSNNTIDGIATDATAIAQLPELRTLTLLGNRLSSWAALQPLIAAYAQLEHLNLAGNPLTTLSSYDPAATLRNPTLRTLDLSHCRIAKITGQQVLAGLPRLEQLVLRGNPLRTVSDMISATLQTLDLSHAKLTFLQPNLLQNMPALVDVRLAHNTRLSLTRKADEYVHSASVQRLDLSYCNMDSIEIGGFPNLTAAVLRGNLISDLRRDTFDRNPLLEDVDLSANAITHVAAEALKRLPLLKHLDLSFNMIRSLDRLTFRHNAMLTGINLSRNFIERLTRIASASLTHLNMSWCEVMAIDQDAFNDMPELLELDLSNNLFSEFPVRLHSVRLQRLDLSRCRLAVVRNETFVGMPYLAELRLAGNRFTTPFRIGYFADNPYLRDIWLGDNPWRCECADDGFYTLFNYLTEGGQRLRDYAHLRCVSPEEVFNMHWEVACADRWFAQRSGASDTVAAQKVWTFLMLSIVVLVAALCVLMSIRRCVENARFARREEEREQNRQEAREIMRRNASMLAQQAQLNAPDPRESRPPCYEDAILLPKFSGSFASLRGKLRSEATTAAGDDDAVDGGTAPLRNRSRSEEVLSPRESVLEQNRAARRQIIADANQRISVHPVLEIPPRFSHNQRSPQPVSRRAIADATNDSIDSIDEEMSSQDFITAELVQHEQSPYAQRRTGSLRLQPLLVQAAGRNRPAFEQADDIEIVDDHYGGSRRSLGRRQPPPGQQSSGSNSETSYTIIG